MANTTAENEADSGSGVATTRPPEHQDDGEHNEAERAVTGSIYDSSERGVKCNQCDFEGANKAALTVHVTKAHTTSNEVEMAEVRSYDLIKY